MDNIIKIVNRGKVAFLYSNDIFEEEIELIERHGQEVWSFNFIATETVRDLLQEYDRNNFLKKYNSCFKHVALAIKKKKME